MIVSEILGEFRTRQDEIVQITPMIDITDTLCVFTPARQHAAFEPTERVRVLVKSGWFTRLCPGLDAEMNGGLIE